MLAPTCAALAFACGALLFALEGQAANETAAQASSRAGADSPPGSPALELATSREAPRAATAFAFEPARRGVVLDQTGAGVGSLALVRQLGDERFELGPCGVDGGFEWPLESLCGELWVEHAGWVCVRGARVDAPARAHARQLVVARATTLRGRVSSAGAPVAHARVAVLLDRAERGAPQWSGARATASADGSFEIAGIPSQTPLSVRVSAADFASRGVQLEAAPERWLELELEPLGADFGHLRGVVLTHAGERADERTWVVWGSNGVRCLADGSFELALRHDPGEAPILVRADGVAPSHSAPAWEAVRSQRAVELRLGPPLELLVGWIRSVDESRELKGCVIELHASAPFTAPLARTRADANGRYEFRGLERGEYWVRAAWGDFEVSAGPIPSGGRAPELVISR